MKTHKHTRGNDPITPAQGPITSLYDLPSQRFIAETAATVVQRVSVTQAVDAQHRLPAQTLGPGFGFYPNATPVSVAGTIVTVFRKG